MSVVGVAAIVVAFIVAVYIDINLRFHFQFLVFDCDGRWRMSCVMREARACVRISRIRHRMNTNFFFLFQVQTSCDYVILSLEIVPPLKYMIKFLFIGSCHSVDWRRLSFLFRNIQENRLHNLSINFLTEQCFGILQLNWKRKLIIAEMKRNEENIEYLYVIWLTVTRSFYVFVCILRRRLNAMIFVGWFNLIQRDLVESQIECDENLKQINSYGKSPMKNCSKIPPSIMFFLRTSAPTLCIDRWWRACLHLYVCVCWCGDISITLPQDIVQSSRYANCDIEKCLEIKLKRTHYRTCVCLSFLFRFCLHRFLFRCYSSSFLIYFYVFFFFFLSFFLGLAFWFGSDWINKKWNCFLHKLHKCAMTDVREPRVATTKRENETSINIVDFVLAPSFQLQHLIDYWICDNLIEVQPMFVDNKSKKNFFFLILTPFEMKYVHFFC